MCAAWIPTSKRVPTVVEFDYFAVISGVAVYFHVDIAERHSGVAFVGGVGHQRVDLLAVCGGGREGQEPEGCEGQRFGHDCMNLDGCRLATGLLSGHAGASLLILYIQLHCKKFEFERRCL